MVIVATLVLLVVVALWVHAVYRSTRAYDEAAARRVGRRWIIGGGILLPGISIAVLLAFGIPLGHHMLMLSEDGDTPLRVEVIGHRWWWEFRYPDHDVASIGRLVIPAGQTIEFHVGSADVIHGFWVPRLGGKIDAVPGRINVLRLRADEPGKYRGQCAEFCGAEHAHMVFAVEALDHAAFDAWLKAQKP